MKTMMMILAASMMVGALANAADMENKGSTTSDTSKNPVTGTTTTTKKWNKKVKGANGEADAKVTEKTKVHKNGKVERTEKVDASQTQEPAK